MAAEGSSAAVNGTVRIAASQIVSTYLLPSIAGDILRELPGLEIEVASSNEAENLLRRDADIALRMFEPRQLDLISRKLCDLEVGVWARRDYLERNGTPLSIEDMKGHRVIGYDRSDLVIRGFRALGHEVGRGFFRFRTDDQVAAFEALRAGLGIGFAPAWLAGRFPELVRIAQDFPIRPMTMWLVTHRELRTSARIRAVADFLALRLSCMR